MREFISSRSRQVDASGIRKVFDLAAKMKNPINLSIGQPDFDVPELARRAMVDAVSNRKNGYSQTQGIPPQHKKLQTEVKKEYAHDDRKLFITSGTSGALVLAMMTLVN